MRIGILGNAGSWYVQDLKRAAAQHGHDAQRVDFKTLTGRIVGGQSVDVPVDDTEAPGTQDFDTLIVRTMPPGSLEQVVYRMDALAMSAAQGTRVFNSPKAVECAVDKYLTSARLAQHGLPVPRTVACENSDQAMLAFAELGQDVVVKPLFGAEGRGIVRLTDPEIAMRTFRTLERIDCVLYVQEFLPHEFDTRVLMLGEEIVGAIRRTSGNDFRTNVSQSGIAAKVELSTAQKNLARRAADVTQAEFAGVDLIRQANGQDCVIEVNAVPGWRAFSKATGIDVADRVMSYLNDDLK